MTYLPVRTAMISTVFVLLLFFTFLSPISIEGARTRADPVPSGYIRLSDLVSQGKITLSGDDHIVSGVLEIPSSTPLYVGPGERILFQKDSALKLYGPPLFDGTTEEPILLEQFTPGQHWKGLEVSESDLGTPSIFNNVTITGGERGIWGLGADLKITDCTLSDMNNSALVFGGPLGASNTVDVLRTTIFDCDYYGILAQDVDPLVIHDVEILGSGTGLRSVRSDVVMEDIRILNSVNMGIYGFESKLDMRTFQVSSDEVNSTDIQVLSTGSDLIAVDGTLHGSRVGLKALVGSNIYLEQAVISNCFKDGIQSDGSSVDLVSCVVRDNVESGLDLRETQFSIQRTSFTFNGDGSGSILYSTLYLKGSSGEIEGCDLELSGYSHIHSVNSRFQVGNSTYDDGGVTGLTLGNISTVTFINNLPPAGIEYLDMYSRIRYLVVQMVEVRNYTTGVGISGAIVDIRDRTGAWVGSLQSDEVGLAGPAVILAYTNTSDGSISFYPMEVHVQSEGYEMLSMDLFYPTQLLGIDMYPPNSPPEIELYSPINGDEFEGSTMSLEGSMEDDLGIYRVKVRIDSGGYQVFDLGEEFTGGNFQIFFPLVNVSTGMHELEVTGFDGVHGSISIIRTIFVFNPNLADSDGDGLLDQMEDVNGNSIWDRDLGETDPQNPDSDGDGLLDGMELDLTDGNSTDPLNEDSDGDFILDGQEDQNRNGQVDEGETDPNNPDTDEDGVVDSKDKYPLDQNRWASPVEEGDDLLLVLIMAVGLLILISILVYVLFVKADLFGKGFRKGEAVDEVEGVRRAPPRPERKGPGNVPREGDRSRGVRRAPPRRERRHGELEREERGWR